MTDKDIDNRIAVLFKQLELIYTLQDEFLGKLGTKGLSEKIDEILDEINHWRKVKKERNN